MDSTWTSYCEIRLQEIMVLCDETENKIQELGMAELYSQLKRDTLPKKN